MNNLPPDQPIAEPVRSWWRKKFTESFVDYTLNVFWGAVTVTVIALAATLWSFISGSELRAYVLLGALLASTLQVLFIGALLVARNRRRVSILRQQTAISAPKGRIDYEIDRKRASRLLVSFMASLTRHQKQDIRYLKRFNSLRAWLKRLNLLPPRAERFALGRAARKLDSTTARLDTRIGGFSQSAELFKVSITGWFRYLIQQQLGGVVPPELHDELAPIIEPFLKVIREFITAQRNLIQKMRDTHGISQRLTEALMRREATVNRVIEISEVVEQGGSGITQLMKSKPVK